MNKIAVLYAGLLRENYKVCFESFKENVEQQNPEYKFDYFLSFWDCEDTISDAIGIWKPLDSEILNYENEKAKFLSNDFKHVFGLLLYGDNSSQSYNRVLNSFLMQMYALKSCWSMFFKYKYNYKYVFKNRYDFLYHRPARIPPLSRDSLHILRKQQTYIFVDNICIGAHQPVATYMNTYNSLIDRRFLTKEVDVRHLPPEYGFTVSRAHNFRIPYNSPERVFEEHLFNNNINFIKDLDWDAWMYGRKMPERKK